MDPNKRSGKDGIYPNVLIVSNECLSENSSNGRTLRNFLIGWPKEQLAQFYTKDALPDFSVCERYYKVSDGDALAAFFGKGKGGGIVTPNTFREATSEARRSGIVRHALTMSLRNFVWKRYRWWKKDFTEWLDRISPEVVLLQAGDSAYMFALAEKLADRLNAALVIYNSEGYYFKKFDYFRAKGPAHWVYPLFHRAFCRQYRRTLERTQSAVYICDKLADAYAAEFSGSADVLYTATEWRDCGEKTAHTPFRASYLGNLGLGRHESLIEIGQALNELSDALYLDVYGLAPSVEVERKLTQSVGIRYHGSVSYGEVTRVMRESDLLVHAESFSDFYREDLKFAFSTKIADSLASGRCFLIYAPEELACTEYLRAHDAAYAVSDTGALKKALKEIVESPDARKRYISNAQKVVSRHHNAKKNAERFREILVRAARIFNEGFTS